MSRWIDEYKNHAFWNTWESLSDILINEELDTDNNQPTIYETARLKKVFNYINNTLEQIDPELLPATFLNSLNQQATNCLSQVTSFKGNQNIGHLNNANTAIDSMLTSISQTPFILSGQQKGALSKSATAYSNSLNNSLKKLNGFIDGELESAQSEIKNLNTELLGISNEITDLNKQIKTADQTIQTQSATFNTQFQTNENTRAKKFDQIEEKLQIKTDKELEKLQNKVDTAFKELSIKSGVILEVLGKYNDDAAKVFGVVVNTLQAGAYSSYANEEKKNANTLRWSAIALMLTGVAVLVVPEIYKFINSLAGYKLDWKLTLGRIPFSLILFVPAFYLARESNKHRNTEILNRRRELILSTIDPYLALLDDDKTQEIKLEIAKGIFSDSNLTNESKSSSAEASNILSQVTNLIKQMK